mgnify:CR=1 FL=1
MAKLNLDAFDKIIVLDFGSQYNQLITRRLRDFGVYSELPVSYTHLTLPTNSLV